MVHILNYQRGSKYSIPHYVQYVLLREEILNKKGYYSLFLKVNLQQESCW